jgi:formylmethanofuran dehydrogenase subunit E
MSFIEIKCSECGEIFFEDDVELKDICEDNRGHDIVYFECPNCGQDAYSERRG